MKRMMIWLFLLFLCGSVLMAQDIFEEQEEPKSKPKRISFRLGYALNIPFAGKAGTGEIDPPTYADAFKQTLGGTFEAIYRIKGRHFILIGFSMLTFDGNSFGEPPDSVLFTDRKFSFFYAGWKMDLFSDPEAEMMPYLKVAVGAASCSKVDMSFYRIHSNYWEKAVVPAGELTAGLQIHLFNIKSYSHSLYIEVATQFTGAQPSLLPPHSDAGIGINLVGTLGFEFSF